MDFDLIVWVVIGLKPSSSPVGKRPWNKVGFIKKNQRLGDLEISPAAPGREPDNWAGFLIRWFRLWPGGLRWGGSARQRAYLRDTAFADNMRMVGSADSEWKLAMRGKKAQILCHLLLICAAGDNKMVRGKLKSFTELARTRAMRDSCCCPLMKNNICRLPSLL